MPASIATFPSVPLLPNTATGTPITVGVGEFPTLMYTGLMAMFRDNDGLEVIKANLPGPQLLKAAEGNQAEVVLLYVVTADAFSMALKVIAKAPSTAVVVFAHDPSDAFGKVALAAGASCLAANADHAALSAADILSATATAARGGRVFIDATGRRTVGGPIPNARRLSPRELDTLGLLCAGAQYNAIAYRLNIGVETVRSHAASIRAKTDIFRRERWAVVLPSDGQAPVGYTRN